MAFQLDIAWGPEADGLCLGIELGKGIYELAGGPVALTLFIANRSDHPIEIIETNLLADYSFEVLRSDGSVVPWSPQGKTALESAAEIRRRVTLRIEPEEVYRVPAGAPLENWFQLDKPGTYSVKAQRVSQARQPRLQSGALQFRIVQPHP